MYYRSKHVHGDDNRIAAFKLVKDNIYMRVEREGGERNTDYIYPPVGIYSKYPYIV